MGKRLQSYKTYFAIPGVEQGEASWDNFKQIKDWGKKSGYDSFLREGRLFLIKENQVIIYEMIFPVSEKRGNKNG